MEVFWSKGYAAPRGPVDALGIGKGGLCHALASRQALFLRALRRYRGSQTEALIAALERPGPVRRRLRGALTAPAEMDLAHPDRRGCPAVNATAERAGIDQEAAGVVRRMLDRTEETFQARAAEGRRRGGTGPGRDPAALGGMRLASRVTPGPDRLTRVIDATLDSL